MLTDIKIAKIIYNQYPDIFRIMGKVGFMDEETFVQVIEEEQEFSDEILKVKRNKIETEIRESELGYLKDKLKELYNTIEDRVSQGKEIDSLIKERKEITNRFNKLWNYKIF